MACNANNSYSGYDVQVVGDFLPQLNCGICMMIIKNAMNGCKKHVFCGECIMKQVQSGIKIDGNVMCPGGCGKVINPLELEPNEFVDRMVNCLTTKCANNNCDWQGDLLDLVQVHQKNCEFILQACVNKGCNEKYLKKDCLQHGEECLFKLIECSYCHTDILRMNLEAHVVECLNEQVKCIYYDIGCKNKLCRRDICSHEETHQAKHTRLIYRQMLTSKYEVTSLRQENTVIRQENEILKNKLIDLETRSNEDVFQLKLEVKTLTKDLKEFKQVNLKLIERTKNLDSNTSNEIVLAKDVAVHMEIKDVKTIPTLKEKINMASSLCGKVSLVNDDKVIIIKCNKNYLHFYTSDILKCYEQNDYNYVFDKFDLKDHKSLMMELLNNVAYNLYEYEFKGTQAYRFVFPLNLLNIKDIEVSIPDIFKMKILNKTFMVEILNQRINGSYLYIEKYQKQLKHQEKFNLRQLSECTLLRSPFAHGYAFLYLCPNFSVP